MELVNPDLFGYANYVQGPLKRRILLMCPACFSRYAPGEFRSEAHRIICDRSTTTFPVLSHE